jgi:hypothetical protein
MFDFSDEDGGDKQMQHAFDGIAAQYGLSAYRCDPKVVGVSRVHPSSVKPSFRKDTDT